MHSIMDDKAFLNWLVDRLVNVHNEPTNADFVVRLRELADRGTEHEHSRTNCSECADLDSRAYDQGRDFCPHD